MKVIVLIQLILLLFVTMIESPTTLEHTTENPFIKRIFLDIVLDKLMKELDNEIIEIVQSRNGRYSRFSRLQ